MLVNKNINGSLRNYYCLIEFIKIINKLKLKSTSTHFELINILLKGKKIIPINKINLKDKQGLIITSKFKFNKFDDEIFKKEYLCHFNMLRNNFVFEFNYAFISSPLENTLKDLNQSEFYYFIRNTFIFI